MREQILSTDEPIDGFVTSWLLGKCAVYFSITVTNDHEQKQLEKVGFVLCFQRDLVHNSTDGVLGGAG